MDCPLVSVITPTYRRPEYLRTALASLVSQSYRNLQIIVRDNASGDETPEVVAAFADPRIEFHQATETCSAYENGGECARHVRGEYFIPLCDDDFLSPNYIEVLLTKLRADSEVLLAYGATRLIDEHGNEVGSLSARGTEIVRAPELIHAWCAGTIPLATGINFLCPTWVLFEGLERRNFANGHHTDNALFLSAGIRGKVLFTDECTFYYRRHSTNTDKQATYQERLEGDRQLLAYLDDEVRASYNVGIPLNRWDGFRHELHLMLAGRYYDLFRVHHRGREEFTNTVKGMLVAPVRVYGAATCFRFLFREAGLVTRQTFLKWRWMIKAFLRGRLSEI